MADFLPKPQILLRLQLSSWGKSLCEHSSDFKVQSLPLEHAQNVRLWRRHSAHVSWIQGSPEGSANEGRRYPPHAHNWHPWRIKTTVERSAHALVQATELRNHWSVLRDSHFKSTAETSTAFRLYTEGQPRTTMK